MKAQTQVTSKQKLTQKHQTQQQKHKQTKETQNAKTILEVKNKKPNKQTTKTRMFP